MKLTRTQRTKLVAGECPKLEFPGPPHDPPCEVGHIEQITKNVRIEVTELRRTAATSENPHGRYSLGYTLHNQRLGSRHLAKQAGQAHPEQYVSSPSASIDMEAGEAVDEFTQQRLTREARERERQEKHEEAESLLAAMNNLRESIDAMPEERRKRVSKTLWTLRSRLDSAERELRRRNAA